MPTRKPIKDLDPKYLDRATVQINSRIPLMLRLRVDEYLEFVSQKNTRRPDHAEKWPQSIAGLIQTSLEDFLDSHPLKGRMGPDTRKDYRRVKTTEKIVPKRKEE